LTFGWHVLLAKEYQQLGKHIVAGAGFVSNFALWYESGYFDNSAEAKPLLHLWSLGIEEQFFYVARPRSGRQNVIRQFVADTPLQVFARNSDTFATALRGLHCI
jgi:hypothetical protein